MYNFPTIKTIDDVLPHITEPSGNIEYFRVIDKEGITYINYNHMGPEVFPAVESEDDIRNKIRRECRGIAFNTEYSTIISRPFHKFFNMGERDETVFDSNEPYVILEKLDGSMIRPLKHPDGSIRWGTKMGVTDVAIDAESFVAKHPEYQVFAEWCVKAGCTPIFEYVGPYNRVVLDYKENMILIGIRNNETGCYDSYPVFSSLGRLFEVPTVNLVDFNWLEKEEVEGIVIRYTNGHMLKVKTEWYVSRHKTKDLLSTDRGFVKAYFEDTIDDILPTLTPEDKQAVELKVSKLTYSILTLGRTSALYYKMAKSQYPTKKDFAIGTNTTPQDWRRQLTFGLWDGKIPSVEAGVEGLLKRALVSDTKFGETMKELGVKI